MKTQKAFTLAEVLVTLVIIGIVSVLTVPALVQEYKKKEASTRLKKFNSMMQQAIQLSEIENGPVYSWEREGNLKDDELEPDNAANAVEAKRYFEKYLKPYLKIDKIETNGKADNEIEIFFLDGSTAILHNGGCLDVNYDVNGIKLPNINGKDRYNFALCDTKSEALAYLGAEKVYWGALRQGFYHSREEMLQACIDSPIYCLPLLKYDNWEFKKDYPYKL